MFGWICVKYFLLFGKFLENISEKLFSIKQTYIWDFLDFLSFVFYWVYFTAIKLHSAMFLCIYITMFYFFINVMVVQFLFLLSNFEMWRMTSSPTSKEAIFDALTKYITYGSLILAITALIAHEKCTKISISAFVKMWHNCVSASVVKCFGSMCEVLSSSPSFGKFFIFFWSKPCG